MRSDGKYIVLPNKGKSKGYTVVYVSAHGNTREVTFPEVTVLEKRAAKRLAKQMNRMRK